MNIALISRSFFIVELDHEHEDHVSVQHLVGFNEGKTIPANSCYKQKQKKFQIISKVDFILIKGCIFIQQL